MSKIKICGIQSMDDINRVNEAKPDYAGFVFAPGRHFIDPLYAFELQTHLRDIQSVGVVVDEPLERLVKIIQISKVAIIQLHGNENEHYIKALRERISIPIWKAIRVQKEEDIKNLSTQGLDAILLDSFTKDEAGGSGNRFAWELLKEIDISSIWIAGGINIGNIKELLALAPYGVDVSSGVETNGKKDIQKMKEIVAEVRANE